MVELYFQDNYHIVEDKKLLKKETNIIDYFTTNGKKFFQCGQGFYQEKVNLICKIANIYYAVDIKGLIKCNTEEKYFVDSILNVKYKKLKGFKLKEKSIVKYTLHLTVKELLDFEQYMIKKNLDFKKE